MRAGAIGRPGYRWVAAKAKLRARNGRLADDDMVRPNRAMIVFLGLAG